MKFNEDLAEIVGIMLGDGGLHLNKSNKYNLTISSDKKELEYLESVKSLFTDYFKSYTFSIWECKEKLSLGHTSVFVGEQLIKAGLKHGNKVNNKVQVPTWIFSNEQFLIRLVRGMFDTDGCIYRKYDQFAQIQFKFGCFETTKSLHDVIKILNFNPTVIQREFNKSKGFYAWKFYLCRQSEIDSFFQSIKPRNPKHVERYNKIRSGDAGIRTQI